MFNGRNYYHKAANTSKCIFILLYIDINIYICIYNGRIKDKNLMFCSLKGLVENVT